MNDSLTARAALALSAAALALLLPDLASAGTGGTAFDPIWSTISEWATGALGKVLAGAMIVVGIAMGVVRQSLIAFASGVAGALGLSQAPTIIDGIITATLPIG